jgi:tetraacyldisaccharide 4'-kinase
MSVQSWLNRIWYERAAPPWWMLPLALAYGGVAGTRRYLYSRRLRRSIRLSCPVVVIGNLSEPARRRWCAGWWRDWPSAA